ncbi:HK97-gp10 family putative phage morphogenesis protein [Mesobacillus zeae]|uniref:HK97 gp10 family phage protein n=1 Tax=Mesobacillus zeae TaxID=1917180 RepID=A0A398B844_9BACI|nr:HK97-gp10 family putative phage morphogenesis protein [Mesobacillus zeae]RID85671.1 HK97 gp10 family phage protein [Mesobacillus zeae]
MIKHKSNLQSVLRALDDAEERALTGVGEFVRSEAQARSPVKTGELRDSNDYKVVSEEQKVLIGNSTDYGLWVHEGSSRQRSQPWLRSSVMENVSRIKNLIGELMRL